MAGKLYTFQGEEAEAYLERQILALRDIYRAAEGELKDVLAAPASTGFAKWRAAEQLKQVRAIVAALNAEARNFARRVTPRAYTLGTDITADRLRAAGITGKLNFGARINTQSVSALTDQMTLDFLNANGSLSLQAERAILRTKQAIIEDSQISQMVAKGVVRGETRRDTSRRIQAELEKGLSAGGKVRIVDKNGVERFYDPAEYAELVARTRTRETVTQGALNFGRANGIDLFQVSYHSTSCPSCASYQGKVYSATGNTDGFPLLTKRPPWHPRCRHVLMPYVVVPGREAEMEALKKLSKSKKIIMSRAEYDAALKEFGYAGKPKKSK